MTAEEKFYARLKVLGLENEFEGENHAGVVLPDGRVIVLVHYDGEKDDPYTEFQYPPYDELWKNEEFRKACKDEYYENSDDNEFVANLARWLDVHGKDDKCPLFPMDLYWLDDACLPGSTWFNYEDDDPEEEEYQAFVERTAEFAGWALKTLDHIRSVLYDAVRTELKRGHNIPYDYSVENGQDHFLDYSFCYVSKEQVKITDSDKLVIECTERDGEKEYDSFEIPFESLSEKQVLDIYESMK